MSLPTLPDDILRLVIETIAMPQRDYTELREEVVSLASLCRVSKAFLPLAQEQLYRNLYLSVYSCDNDKGDDFDYDHLHRTLVSDPHFGTLVRSITFEDSSRCTICNRAPGILFQEILRSCPFVNHIDYITEDVSVGKYEYDSFNEYSWWYEDNSWIDSFDNSNESLKSFSYTHLEVSDGTPILDFLERCTSLERLYLLALDWSKLPSFSPACHRLQTLTLLATPYRGVGHAFHTFTLPSASSLTTLTINLPALDDRSSLPPDVTQLDFDLYYHGIPPSPPLT
jgi:hypothetical protein